MHDDELDGCEVDMTAADQLTGDDDIDALVMFADVFDNPELVELRRRDLIELDGGDV